MEKQIRIAIIGVGNCASSLIQGIYYYKGKNEADTSGLLNYKIDKYKPSDIKIVAAFDIDDRKIEKDISEAIFENPNNTKVFYNKIPKIGVKVSRGPTLDGLPEHMDKYDENIRFVECE